ncbi:MAG: glycosyltransferase [Rhizonema sp. NSF051]|nr:glycosyltransferase [Rhizonema sp. NSF051]
MQESPTEKLQPLKLPQLPENPLVSVLIGNYNYARYIGETLDSVLCQTYPYFEVIICDDGSKDNSCEVIETYIQKDSRIKLIRKQNGGVATALNAAYQESKGQIICILDADDLWMPEKLQRIVEKFQSAPKCGFVIHNVIEIDGHGNFIKQTPKLKELASGWMAPLVLENGGYLKNIPPASALTIRREVARLIFPLNEAMIRHTDSLICFLAPLVTEIGSVPEVLSKFRLHGANITSATALTVDAIERGHLAGGLLYQEQKKFLKNVYGTEIEQRLASQEFNLPFCFERYLIARLKHLSQKECREVHEQLISHPKFSATYSWFRPHRWLLQWYLPDALFMMMFNQVYGSTHLKQLVRGFIGGRLTASRVHG